jgi:hypothetical protein
MNKLSNFRLFSYLEKLSEWAFRPSSLIGRLPRFAILSVVFYIFLIGCMVAGIILLSLPYLTIAAISAITLLLICLICSDLSALPVSVKNVVLNPMLSCYALIFIGFSLFSAILTPYTLNTLVFSGKQLPLGDLDGMVLCDNNMYVSVPFYRRIQKYNLEGTFIKSWPVDSAGGKYDLWADNQNNINVAVSRTNMHIIYNSNGDVIDRKEVPIFSDWKKLIENIDPYFAQDSKGNRYVLNKSQWFPKIIKISPTGKEEVIIKDPIYLSVNRAPFPALLYVIMGIIISPVLKVLKIKSFLRKLFQEK